MNNNTLSDYSQSTFKFVSCSKEAGNRLIDSIEVVDEGRIV